jgi:hypothetical protein
VWLAIHPDVRKSPRVKAVADLLSEIISAESAALE